MFRISSLGRRYLEAMICLSALVLGFLVLRLFITGNGRYYFIPENLALAWAALGFAAILSERLQKHPWRNYPTAALAVLWLCFLPNTWYVITDFIHLYPTGEISLLYDVIMMTILGIIGASLGIASIFLVHRQLLARYSRTKSLVFVEVAIALSSFAVYLGRDLRWNTWDVITNPAGIVLNISDRLADPLGNSRAINVTVLFFVMISALYLSFWHVTKPSIKRD